MGLEVMDEIEDKGQDGWILEGDLDVTEDGPDFHEDIIAQEEAAGGRGWRWLMTWLLTYAISVRCRC